MAPTTLSRRGALAVAAAALARPALAQEFPAAPIRIVVPFPAGSTTDLRARLFADRMAADWRQPVVVDNRGGANGFIAAELVARARPDGYTVLFGSNTLFSTNPAMFRRLPYDPVGDFAPITLMGVSPMVVLVNNRLPVRRVEEFLAYARARPGRLNFASGNGSSRGAGELFKAMAELDMVHIGYQSSPQALTALMAGDVHLFIVDGGAGVPPAKEGQLRAIATTGRERMATLAEVPTVMESGVPGYEFASWTAVFVPRATPPEIVARLHGKITEIGRRPEILERMQADGSAPRFGPPEELAGFIAEDVVRWRRVVEISGMGEG
ncbi:Bug family tripartite tricarboxylate transporter substrate binding protein [Muricoccus radiodurans]|uniref:Bug family tripartite tricarboxylate transporter substrate binding protein n=1 Tax=Muricoccus radiodurans TaxID=2231721 RepID=UPI003CFAFF89